MNPKETETAWLIFESLTEIPRSERKEEISRQVKSSKLTLIIFLENCLLYEIEDICGTNY